jgi:IS5 family transposase
MSTDDFFGARLETMIGMHYPLAVLATRMPWKDIEAALAPVLTHKGRAGHSIEGAELSGPTLAVA